jgi:hypothetical protein
VAKINFSTFLAAGREGLVEDPLLKPIIMRTPVSVIFTFTLICLIFFAGIYPVEFKDFNTHIIIEEDFSGKNPLDQVHQQFGTPYAFTVTTDPEDSNNKVGRFELRMDDPITSNGKRTEVLFPPQETHDRWYSYSVYLPSEDFQKDRDNDILNQWHQSKAGSPTTSFRVKNDRFLVRSGNTKASRKDYDLGPATKDTWHEFVFHIVHSPGVDGLVEVWHNGKKVLTRKGGNMYDIDQYPRWKIGIYKASWAKRTTDTQRRVIYFDNIKLGDQSADYSKMTSRRRFLPHQN